VFAGGARRGSDPSAAASNPLLGINYFHPFGTAWRFTGFLATAIPIGSGGGDDPDPGAAAAMAAALSAQPRRATRRGRAPRGPFLLGPRPRWAPSCTPPARWLTNAAPVRNDPGSPEQITFGIGRASFQALAGLRALRRGDQDWLCRLTWTIQSEGEGP
jgi:hypothetical protein